MSDRSLTREKPVRARRRTRVTIAGAALVLGVAGAYWLVHSREGGGAPARAAPPPAQVVVSHPVERDLAEQLGFLGQFSAVEQVELRAQVGGTLTEIHFKDGDIVHKGDLLFAIDPRPYDIRLAQADGAARKRHGQARPRQPGAGARPGPEEHRRRHAENVDQRLSEQHAAQAAVDRGQGADPATPSSTWTIAASTAPFTGRIGTHLVSVGNLVAGSRGGASPTTLLATLVSVDPIYLDFDMSESDSLAFARARAKQAGGLAQHGRDSPSATRPAFARRGTLDFVDNVLDRSSGTLHARATVAEPGRVPDAGRIRPRAPDPRGAVGHACWCRTRRCCRISPSTSC